MNREETWALYLQGHEAWNAWAEEMLAKRKSFEDSGRWAGLDRGGWLRLAFVDFRGAMFSEGADFSRFEFPTNATFNDATFHNYLDFDNAVFLGDARFNRATFGDDSSFYGARFEGNARFDRSTFLGDADFLSSLFLGPARFSGVSFHNDVIFENASFSRLATFSFTDIGGEARFGDATFSGDATFNKTTFSGDARFGGVKFSKIARFNEARFLSTARFGDAVFSGNALFRSTTFSSNARFGGAMFDRMAAFDYSRFQAVASFGAVIGGVAFSLTGSRFLVVPDFIQAHFEEASRLDDIQIEPRKFSANFIQIAKRFRTRKAKSPRLVASDIWQSPHLPDEQHSMQFRNIFVGTHNRAARWRSLRRLATQGHDHAREMDFFAGEIVASRWAVHGWRKWPMLLFGYAFQLLSNFGRSLLLPFLWWCLALASWACWYMEPHLAAARPGQSVLASLWQRIRGDDTALACIVGSGDPWWMALQLSLRKGLLFVGLDSTEKLGQIHACLHGVHNPSVLAPRNLSAEYAPIIPDSVAMLGLGQTLVSAILIFLFLLAVRNHFRIK